MSSGTYSGSYAYLTLSSSYATVTLTSTADVTAASGNAVSGGGLAAYTIFNLGHVAALGTEDNQAFGIYLRAGGAVVNGAETDRTAYIGGEVGIEIYGGAGTVENLGSIVASGAYGEFGIYLRAGGTITNGSTTTTSALVQGREVGVLVEGAVGTVHNFGTIASSDGVAIDLGVGGEIVNGSGADTAALIDGNITGVEFYAGAMGTLENFGTIETGASGERAVFLTGGGSVLNGDSGDVSALITGVSGIVIYSAAGTVTNFGTISASSSGQSDAVELNAGGVITNGDATDTGAAIDGGVIVQSTGTVTNFGTMGELTLGSGTISNVGTASLIVGRYSGVFLVNGALNNDGTICATAGTGVQFEGGVITNGGTDFSSAVMEGALVGVALYGSTSQPEIDNFGTIEGASGIELRGRLVGTVINYGTIDATASYGISVAASGSVVNHGLIEGTTGLTFGAGSTIVNSGTIESTAATDGIAIHFTSLTDNLLVQESTGAVIGTIAGFGFGDTIDLAAINYADASYTYAAGELSIFQHGNVVDVFDVTRPDSVDTFKLLSDGTTGTDIILIAPPHTPGTYADTYAGGIEITYSPATLLAGGAIESTASSATAVSGTLTGQVFDNFGVIEEAGFGGIGIKLTNGGTVDNRGTIMANTAISLLSNDGANKITNSGLIGGGVTISRGTVDNFGSIQSNTSAIQGLFDLVVNGSSTNTTASITGSSGVLFQSNFDVVDHQTTLLNYGTIYGSGGSGNIGAQVPGTIVNGSATNTSAFIHGYVGAAAGSIANYGTIDGEVTERGLVGYFALGWAGVELINGILDNGSASDTAALVEGHDTGVSIGPLVNRQQVGGTIVNFGTIETRSSQSGTGVASSYDTRVVNGTTADTSALITGSIGIYTKGSYTGISNFGTIAGGGDAIVLANGGTVVNGSSADTTALINGRSGIFGFYAGFSGTVGAAVTVTNFGTILGVNGAQFQSIGVNLPFGGTITNEASGLIEGRIGVVLNGKIPATLINAGTIEGTDNFAVQMGYKGGLLVDDPGAAFIGTVSGGPAGTLELASAAVAGTLSGLGVSYYGFATVAIDAGAHWSLGGTNTLASGGTLIDRGTVTIGASASMENDGLIQVNGGVFVDDTALTGTGTVDITNGGTVAFSGSASGTTVDFDDGSTLELSDPNGVTIRDFAAGDTIDLTGVAYSASDTVTYKSSLHEIVVYDAGHSALATLDVRDLLLTAGQSLTLAADGTISAIEVVCFLEGTRILTERGEVPVERLAEGDLVVTASGGLEPVRWIGKRRMNSKRHPSPEKVYPIRIKRNAFADGIPMRDLLVSPGHAIYANRVLIPAHRLVNGVTILQDFEIAEPYYFHIELDAHDVLLAEGLAAESYLDSGNRGFFENGGPSVDLFALPDSKRRGKGRCAPLKNGGAEASAIKQALLQRVRATGHVAGRRPELRLEIDGRVILPVSVKRWTYRFELPLHYREVRLVSQTAIGGATRAGNFDARRLGVAVLDITQNTQAMDLRDLRDGWHRVERDGGKRFRWTDGDALLPIVGPGTLEIRLLRPAERWIRQVDLVKLRRA